MATVTGASKGLGRALAEALAGHGWDLVLDARNAEVLKGAAGLAGHGTRVAAVPGDVRTRGTARSWWRRPGGWAGRTCW